MKHLNNIEEIADSPQKVILTIGNYDGVHLGHRKIISEMKEKSRKLGVPTCLLTFFPHPRTILESDAPVKLITVSSEKSELLEKAGLDILIEQPFSREFSNMDAKEFLEDWLFKKITPLEIHIGKDFRFGKHQSGDQDKLSELAKKYNFKLNIVDDLTVETTEGKFKASSTEIRKQLEMGNIQVATELLGYPYFVKGTVIKGQGRGKSIGIPTANLQFKSKLLPKTGVYATKVTSLIDNVPLKAHHAVSNIGFNPTFENREDTSVETHLLNWSDSLYGVRLKIEFIKRIRDEKKFPSAESLVEQIRSDIKTAQELFASR